MDLRYQSCQISLRDDLVTCSYDIPMGEKHWEIALSGSEICYREGKKEKYFNVDDIQEFEFEMGKGGGRYQDIPLAIAYVVPKADPDPRELFVIRCPEEYTLLNQTKAYDFCDQTLTFIGNRYQIPTKYKLSVDTRKKRNKIPFLFLCLIVLFVWLWLIVHFKMNSNH